MCKHGRRIIGHSGIYLLGSLLARAVSFIMLPIYTRCLTPSDYGVIELLTMVLDLVGLLVSVRVGQSIYRYYYKYDQDDDRKEVLFTAFASSIATSFLAMLCVILLARPLAQAFFGNVDLVGLLRLFSLSMVFQGLIETPMVMFRARQKPWFYLAASIFKLVLMLGLNIYFVVVRQMHVEGVVYSGLLSGGIVSLVLGAYLCRETGFSFSFAKAREMLWFNLPFMAVGALSFYLNFGDRYFLRLFGGGLDAVGIYSLGYKFGFMLIFIAGDPFFNVWDSEKFRIYRENADPPAVYGRVFLLYSAVLAVVALCLSLFGRNVIMVMANREYWAAANLIPYVCLAYVCNCITGYANLGILVKERTIEYTYGSIFAGVVVTAGYLLLIPRYGGMGAAWATLLAYGSRMIWVIIRSKGYYDMKLDWVRVIGLWIMAGIIWQGAEMLGRDSLVFSVIGNLVMVTLCLALLLFVPILPADLRYQIRKWLFDPRKSFRNFLSALGTK